jgi:hypothetical protein
MRYTLLASAALGLAVSFGGSAFAQVPGTNLGTTETQPRPGGGVAAGPGAPTSAAPLIPGGGSAAAPSGGTPTPGGGAGSAPVERRGPPPGGSGTAAPGGDPGTSTLAPTGAIRPGTSAPGGTGGSSSSN